LLVNEIGPWSRAQTRSRRGAVSPLALAVPVLLTESSGSNEWDFGRGTSQLRESPGRTITGTMDGRRVSA
jgi:hypothetical protein